MLMVWHVRVYQLITHSHDRGIFIYVCDVNDLVQNFILMARFCFFVFCFGSSNKMYKFCDEIVYLEN